MIENGTVKERALRLVDSLPDDATWDDLMYAIYVRQSAEGSAGEEGFRVMPWIREIRDRVYEETKHMSAEERDAYTRERADSLHRKQSGQ
ncbi:MAG TPA: hypothetical protein VFS20_22490 [Longimicrobium sp.]|nr:hypothetical protein [Longimicrobium sp.]